ncbi:helix-turn-helix transcriptional regulator [Thermomonospora echinospora]|nr:LuxR family transcriptional regulator [Thermomonospora echinospora]
MAQGDRTAWPFTGREAELEAVARFLRGRRGRGVLVSGEAGTGRTRLAAQAVAGIAGTVWVTGTGATATLPFGAFAHLLPAGPAVAASVSPLRRAAEAVCLRRPTVLVVDDAHLLDSASAALVHHLVRNSGTRMLLTVRTGTATPDAVAVLGKDGLLPRIDLRPFGEPEVARVLAEALDGHVEALTVRRLAEAVRGDLLLLRELVTAGLAGGALLRTDEVWRWRGGLPVTGRVRERVEAAIGALDEEERQALELVAFGAPLAAEPLLELAGAGAVERLEARHLITCERDTAGGRERLRVRPVNPLHGQAMRDSCGRLRARRITRRLADALQPSGEETLRVAVWRLDNGDRVDPAVLVEACRLAWASYDTALAERLGRAALAADGGPSAMLALGTALSLTGWPPELDALLTRLSAALTSDREQAEYAVSRAYAATFGADGAAGRARRILAEAAERITAPAWRQHVLGVAVLLEAYHGTAAGERLARIRALAPAADVVAARLATAEALMLAQRGQGRRSLAVAAETLSGRTGWHREDPALPLPLTTARLIACLHRGDLDHAWACVATGERLLGENAAWDCGLACLYGHRAQICRLRGEVEDALRWSREGALRLRGGPAAFAGLCLGELAHAAALTGDTATARWALARARRQSVPAFRAVGEAAGTALPWVLAAAGDLRGAVRAALAAAARAARRGLPGQELFALHDVVRLGRAEPVVERLARLADRVDGPLAPALARHAAALAAGDPAELEAVAKQFGQFGLLLHAAEAQAHAATAYRRLDDPRRARTAATEAWALAVDCQGARTPALAVLAAPALTARQREIAWLAAAGLTNRQIADRLTISVRTAANHLCAVYGRLGVNDREGLAALLARLDTRPLNC